MMLAKAPDHRRVAGVSIGLALTLLVGAPGPVASQEVPTVASQEVSAFVSQEASTGASPETTAALGDVDSVDLSHLRWRSIGPGGLGGRIVDFAVRPDDHDTIYVATAHGGVWKTIDGGIVWEPVFENEGSSAIGGIAVAQSNPNVVWVGTGEPNGRNLVSTSWGDGVYRSEDGGKSWRNMGLPRSQQIGRIRIHPADENVVYVPVVGSLWHDSPEHNAARGLWRTVDGGVTWDKILSAGEHAGLVDLDLDPRDPDVLYAAAWQRERVDWSWLPTGDESGLFRTTDGGESWRRVINGLPTERVGRVGVSVCLSDPDVVYSIFEGPEGGVFRSDDRGASWERRSAQLRGSHWYAQIRCDPNDPERVYVLETRFMVSHDGGRTFANEMAGKPVHVDHHALWIDPADSDHLVLGNDGGIYLSGDRGEHWRFVDLPITQFFEIGVGLQEPFYFVCGGTQDNNSYCGPSATRSTDGIVNDDWFQVSGGDGFYAQTDPTDPTIVYSESQHGGLLRTDTRTGERKRIKPVDPRDLRSPSEAEGEEAATDRIDRYRWNWSAPLLISRWDPATIYFGAQVVLRSGNRGDSWEVISPDLTRGLTYENLMNDFGTIRVIAESPLLEGLMAVGTDDGLVQLTDDGGATWRATEPLPGVPDMALVRRIVLSAHDPETIYVASSFHEYNDFAPYILRSRDRGRSWESIRANLPDGSPIRALAEHPGNPELLFVGTEHGVWATLNGGDRWISIKNDLPTVAIHDMLVHPRDNDLVVGTHGRGIWILDNLNVLEGLAGDVLSRPAHVFPTRPTMQFHRFNRGRSSRGSTYFRAPNPPDGVTIDLWIGPAASMAGDGGADSGTEASGGDVSDAPASRATGDRAPRATLTIHDESGARVRRIPIESSSSPGLHRIVWDLRHEPAWVAPTGGGRARGFGLGGQRTVRGPWVLPGRYEARLTVGEAISSAAVEIVGDPLVEITEADRRDWHDLQISLSEILGTERAATAQVGRLQEALSEAEAALSAAAPSGPDGEEARDLLRRATERADAVGEALGRVSGAAGQAYTAVGASTSRPTDDQVRVTEVAGELLAAQLDALEALLGREIPRLRDLLAGLAIPWALGDLLPVGEPTRRG